MDQLENHQTEAYHCMASVLDDQGTHQAKKGMKSKAIIPAPSVFDYTDYRRYLQDAFNHKKSKNPSYSESAFIRQVGLGANSRGYLSMIIKGKRNLSSKTIFGFIQALKLNGKESLYFENLILFNQANDEKEKVFYYERMEASAEGVNSKKFELLRAQYNYVSKWYLVAIRETVGLKDFKENPTYICKKLRGKVTKKQVEDSIEHLLSLGLLCRDEKGKLFQSEPIVNFTDSTSNFKDVISIHKQFLDRTKEVIEEDSYEHRSVRCVTIACQKEQFEEIRNRIKDFMGGLLDKYGKKNDDADTLLHIGTQLFHLDETK